MAREEEILAKLRDVTVNLDIKSVQEACKEAIEAGVPAYKILSEGLAKGMKIVGEKYENHEYFLAELVVAGETMKEGMKIIEPHLKGEVKTIGKVVIGTVKGDMHDIGKNVVITMLTAAGFYVIDLGTDVPLEKFIEEVKKNSPDILGMSALLTTTMIEMENVIKALKEAGLRDQVKVILGGAPVTKEYADGIGADSLARDAAEAIAICKSWVA
ncbi:MAG: B12-binding domain-containing protein [Candidatus Lokiarchaeia archaeon]